jgi:enoyl-CoA hydratase/carnithine racemase
LVDGRVRGDTVAELLPFEVETSDQVATIRFIDPAAVQPPDYLGDIHYELGVALEHLRWDESVRVIVMTGKTDGYFQSILGREIYEMPETQAAIEDIIFSWTQGNGSLRTHQVLALIEKPIVARVNGDVSGFGQSVLFACDIIVAWEDAQVTDGHFSMGEIVERDGTMLGAPFGMVPGDGAMAWLPGLMPATKAKEYLMLSQVFTGRQLADMNVFNFAVPLEDLDRVTDDVVRRLLARPAHELAITKRLMNKKLLENLNLVLDAADAQLKLGLAGLGRRKFENRYSFGQ